MGAVKGVVRRIDHLGRVVIPVELRRVFAMNPGDELDIGISPEGDSVTVMKVQTACVFCQSTDSLAEHQGKLICGVCRKEIAGTLPVSIG